jgi:hypothetical protein
MKRDSDAKKNKQEVSDDEYIKHHELKEKGLKQVLGQMHNMVGHALIPFQVGGNVDMYYFPHALDGTAFATMELIEPDGSGPVPSEIGTYELVAFTKHRITDDDQTAFDVIERRMCGIFTVIGRYSHEAKLDPFDTCEIPATKNQEVIYLVFDEYKKPDVEFKIGNSKHGLLLCIEVFPSEMKYAQKNGTLALLNRLKAKRYYPYSDLDREPVA